MFKLRAHHDLNGTKQKFADPLTREIRVSALRGAAALDMGLEDS